MDRRGSGIARSSPGADQPLAVQRGAQPLVTHVALDDARDRLMEQHLDKLAVVAEQAFEPLPRGRVPDPHVVIRRAQRLTDAREELFIAGETVDVVRRYGGDLGAVARGVVPQGE